MRFWRLSAWTVTSASSPRVATDRLTVMRQPRWDATVVQRRLWYRLHDEQIDGQHFHREVQRHFIANSS